MGSQIKIFKNFKEIATLSSVHAKDGRNLLPSDLSIISDATVVFNDDSILWVGKDEDLPNKFQGLDSTQSYASHVLVPQIVDSHTHLVFGGDRSHEYTMRLNGADYQDIANAGGGILATMNNTNSLNDEELFNLATERINRIYSYGVGAIEIKSGYSLTYEGEKRLSILIDRLKKKFSGKVTIHNTFMAAHAIPKNYSSSKEYISKVCIPLLKELSSLNIIDSIDIFHEKGYFTHEDVKMLFDLANTLGIPKRIHADEFNDNSGGLIAANNDCLSADHLLAVGSNSVQALSKSKTVATLLPGTGFFLGKNPAPARMLLDSGCKVAIASDYNPGSCHCDNLLQIASISAATLKLNITELWSGITYNSAHSLGLFKQGAIVEGFSPKFSIFKCDSISQITYNWGRNFSINSKVIS